MNSSQIYRINRPDIVYEKFDDEILIINLDTGYYYSYAGVGVDIWSLIESGAAVGEIVEGILRRYECDSADDIENAIERSITELERENLIVPDTTAGKEDGGAGGLQAPTEPRAGRLKLEAPTLEKYTDMEEFLLVDPIHEVDPRGWPHKKQD